jgi:transcriptional regulator with XRE-family HTH domain
MSDLKLYKTYSFRDKDPIIDRLRTLVADNGTSYADIGADSGVSPHTLWQWFRGPTRRPQFATVKAVARALGHDIEIVPYRRGHRTGAIRQPRLRVVAGQRG